MGSGELLGRSIRGFAVIRPLQDCVSIPGNPAASQEMSNGAWANTVVELIQEGRGTGKRPMPSSSDRSTLLLAVPAG